GEKVEEEMKELKEAITNSEKGVMSPEPGADSPGLQAAVEEEFGDLVFSLINYARFLQVDAENALEKTNKKFIHRFSQMEQQALASGTDLDKMTLEEMDAIWNSIKRQG